MTLCWPEVGLKSPARYQEMFFFYHNNLKH